MKFLLIAILSLLYLTKLSAQTQDIVISKVYTDANLDEVLQDLSQSYNLQFAYNSKVFRQIKINTILDKKTVNQSLDKLIANSDYRYKKINDVYVFYPKYQAPPARSDTVNKNLTWSAVVQDFESHEVLPYASVYIASNGKGVTSNEDGYFTLKNIPSDTSTIIISYVGYSPLTLQLNAQLVADQSPIYLTQNSLIAPVPIYREREPMLSNRQTVQEIDINLVKTLPAVGDQDVFNSLQLLSGVDGTGERPGDIRIRGGASDENLVVLDGFTLYHIDHFYQLYSTINASATKHVRIHKGWYEPKFGGRTSGIIEIQGKEGNLNHSKTEVGLNFNSANIFFETPLQKSKSSVVFAARKSITELYASSLYQNQFNTIFNQSSPNLTSTSAFDFGDPEFDYSDVNVKFNFLLSEKSKVNFTFFYSNDQLFLNQVNDVPELGLNVQYRDNSNWKNKGMSTRWVQKWNKNWFSNLTIGYSTYSSKFLGEDVRIDEWFNTVDTLRNDQTTNVSDLSIRFNNDLNWKNHQISFGIHHTTNQIDYSTVSPGNPSLNNQQNGSLATVYLQDKYRWRKIEILGGIRMNNYSVLKENTLLPRIALTYDFHPLWSSKIYFGKNYQVIRNTQRQDLFLGIADIWSLAGEGIPVSKSSQYGLEISKKFEAAELNASIYQRQIDGALYDLQQSSLEFETANEEPFSIGTKNIQGLDFQLIKSRGKHRGWASISLMRVVHQDHDVIPYEFYDDYDQFLEGKIAYSLNINQWNFGAVMIYGSGKPYSAALGTYDLALVNGENKVIINYDILNNERLPAYHRLDLSATRYFFIKESIGELGLAIFNVYGQENTADIRYYAVGRSSDSYELLEKKVTMMGFMPGLKFKFTF